ncbi:hypothetical protein GCM10009582_33380 [Arthrobacter flavus]
MQQDEASGGQFFRLTARESGQCRTVHGPPVRFGLEYFSAKGHSKGCQPRGRRNFVQPDLVTARRLAKFGQG